MPSLPEVADPSPDADRVDAAASWFARLNADTVSIQDLNAFQAWRREPLNDQAYREVEAMWGRGEALRADPEIARVLATALKPTPPGRRTKTIVMGFGAAAALLLAVVLGVWAEGGALLGERTYQTAVGQHQEIVLADGSSVRLDTDTRVAARFARSERLLTLLRGRAFFSVAHDAHRPFIVLAGDTRVRAVGTRFSVRRDPADVQVVLVQGVVTVSSRVVNSDQPRAWTLKAGQQLIAGGAVSGPSAADVALATSWLQNRLVFRDLPLNNAIAEVNRYTADKVVLDAPDASETPLSGVFNAGDPAGFAAAAADVCGLEVHPGANGTLLLRRRAMPPPA